ncbi:MAG: stalk domain-containing protein [Bacillota bacterium]
MRRRWMIGGLVAALALVSAAAGAWAATSARQQIEVEYRQIQIMVDGQPVVVDAEPFIHLQAGRTFIPARPLAEALGAKVEWDGERNIVQVYTKGYVTSRVEGNNRVWSMPGAGFELRSPLGWIRQEAAGSALLHLALPGTDGLNGLVSVTQLPENLDPLATQFDQVVQGMGSIYTDLQLSTPKEGPGRITASGTAKLVGEPVRLTVRMIEGTGGHWLLMGIYPQAGAETMGPAIQGILDSFLLK